MRFFNLAICFLILIFTFSMAYSAEFSIGVSSGIGMIEDESLRNEYGNSIVYNSHLGIRVHDRITLHFGLEGGYKKESDYFSGTTLKLSGLIFFAEYAITQGNWYLYAKGGLGVYRVINKSTAEELKQFDFDETSPAFIFGLGVKLPVKRNLYFIIEVDELAIQIKPFDGWGNAGGGRILAGLVFRFKL